MTDSIQHRSGFESEAALWSMGYADSLVGVILHHLRHVQDVTFLILSDHGHFTVTQSLRPQLILPGLRTDSEGTMLHVHVESDADEARAADALAKFGVVPWNADHIPADQRDHIRVFLAPDGTSFEQGYPDDTEPAGPPHNISSHGHRPGHPGDDRFMLLSGAGIARGTIEGAAANQVAPTIASLLGLDTDVYEGEPLL